MPIENPTEKIKLYEEDSGLLPRRNYDEIIPKTEKENSIENNEIVEKEKKETSNTDIKENKNINSEYSKEKVKIFLIKLAKACKRHEFRIKAREQLHNHISEIRKHMISKRPVKPEHVDQHLEELKNHVNHLVNIEKNSKHLEENKLYQQKIAELENKLNLIIKSKELREERFRQLEKKINAKLNADKEVIKELERKLLILNKKLIEYKLKNKSSKNDTFLKEISERIELTKEAIEKVKNNKI